MLKQDLHIFSGMQRDPAISKQKAEFLWDAKNIRLTAREQDTLLAMTNEKGTTRLLNGVVINGKYLGHAVLNNYLVLFTISGSTNYIYRIDKIGSDYKLYTLYEGQLNFNLNYPIETLSYYETANIQKVYWIDGKNQPRVINIVKEQLEDEYKGSNTAAMIEKVKGEYGEKLTPFDFVPHVNLTEKVEVLRLYNSNGLFPSGVTQYAFTYYNKYGSETNIIHTTPLYYNIHKNRAGSPEDKISLSYKLFISNLDKSFDYLRVYSITRTSLDAVPTVKIIGDYSLKEIPKVTHPFKFSFETVPVDSPFPSGNIDGHEGKKMELFSDVTCYNTLGNFLELVSNYDDNTTFNIESLYGDYANIDSMYLKYNDVVYKIVRDKITLTKHPSVVSLNTNNQWYKVVPKTEEKEEAILIEDNNTTGEVVDPTLLLYIGGEQITANAITQKDNTLFLGNYSILRPSIDPTIKNELRKSKIDSTTRTVVLPTSSDYLNTLDSRDNDLALSITSPIGFKGGETYRLGVQFQHISGRWSEPCFINDKVIADYPSLTIVGGIWKSLKIPSASCTISNETSKKLIADKYIRARAVMVYPSYQDRSILAQGVITPTVFSIANRIDDKPYAQSSWFFRPFNDNSIESNHLHTLKGYDSLYGELQGVPKVLSGIKVNTDGSFLDNNNYGYNPKNCGNIFAVDQSLVTFHSPDIELTEDLWNTDLEGVSAKLVGVAVNHHQYSDINIQTKTPAIKGHGSATSLIQNKELYSDFLYTDSLVDDSGNKFNAYSSSDINEVDYLIYPWQASGSLNNDINRPADGGTRTAVLYKKKLSNIKYFNTTYKTIKDIKVVQASLYKSEQTELIKIRAKGKEVSYYGNIDTMVGTPSDYSSIFKVKDSICAFNLSGSYAIKGTKYNNLDDIGDTNNALRIKKDAIRIKYKSSPHLLLSLQDPLEYKVRDVSNYLYVVDLYKPVVNRYGGNTEYAINNNLWIPCGDIVTLEKEGNTLIEFKYGDTFYQRYDCLKTYPFTLEDENSVIEIGSFVLENRVNVEGRYDRNKGLQSNIYVHSTNFNKMNPVYKQANTYFNFRTLDKDLYKQNTFDISITWSLQKKAGDNTDLWTKVTLANVLDLNGEKGKITKLTTLNDNVIAFQERAISQILFNNRVQIPTSDGVPIEISNNYKVDGSRYISDSLGCLNKFCVTHSNNGLYFIDSISNGLYNISNGLVPISDTHGMSNWFLNESTLNTYGKLFYDYNYNDLYINTDKTTLGYSEVLNQFISFYDYQDAKAMFNIGSEFFSIITRETNDGNSQCLLYSMFTNTHSNIFDEERGSNFTFISNADSVVNKTFTNIDIRADLYGPDKSIKSKLFDSIRVWNEYQDTGDVTLNFTNAKPSNLKKKFRIWRLNIPRDKKYKLDRISNTWAKIQLNLLPSNDNLVLHDLNVVYHI
mgnify:CR=1 FL=1